MEFNNRPLTPEIQQWIAEQNEIFSREGLTIAIEAQTEAIEAHTEAIIAQTAINERLATANEDLASEISTLNERLAPCDFTQWRISECLSNLAAEIRDKRGE